MDHVLRAGIAVYNAGEFHAAHDAWEDRWLELDAGTDDERLLHGLIQFTAAVHHARSRNWSGCVGLCSSAIGYLEPLGEQYRGVDVARVRSILRALELDPERIERQPAPKLRHRGTVVTVSTVRIPELTIAAATIAGEKEYDRTILEDAGTYAAEEADRGRSQYAGLLTEFVRNRDQRAIVYNRLKSHVERQRAKENDVTGLFDSADE